MPRPEYLICLECESEVEDFTWRDGEVRKAACEVCGNSDPDAFALPEDFDQDSDGEEDEEEEDEEELIEDYDDFEEEEEE
jgi:ferredoxin